MPSNRLFALELHSTQPKELAQFYEQALGIKFSLTTYPFRRYIAELGQIALIISQSEGHGAETISESGKVTFSFLVENKYPGMEPQYFLHPQRPMGGVFPSRCATRLQDPDGNYLALAPPLEQLLGAARAPLIFSLRQLFGSILEYGRMRSHWWRLSSMTKIDEMLDLYDYSTNSSLLAKKSCGEYTHVVASLAGLFVVNANSYKRILRGKFFGVAIKDEVVYCFQGCDSSNRGRLLKITLHQGQIDKIQVIAKGLDSGCHQIDFVGEDLLVVDCYNGRILQMREGCPEVKMHYPLGKMSRKEAMSGCHVNSVMGNPDGTIWLLLHNNFKRHSEVLILNAAFEPIRRFPIDAGGAHNIVFTGDELEYLIADTFGGRIISSTKTVIGKMLMLRGISLDLNSCVVGEVFFASRPLRRYVPGRVHFFDRHTWQLKSSVSLPGAPTEIRRLDGKDLSLSNYFACHVKSEG